MPTGELLCYDSIEMSDRAKQTINVQGMDCASCVAHVEKAIRKLPGIESVSVNLALGRAHVSYDPHSVGIETITDAVTGAGYPAKPQATDSYSTKEHDDHHADHARTWFWRGMIALLLWAPVELLHWILKLTGEHRHGVTWMEWLAFASSTLAIVLVGSGFYKSAFKAAMRGTTNMDTLISMGASVAYLYSAVAMFGFLARLWNTLPELYFMESSALLALISIGHWLEAQARNRAGSAIRELMNLVPEKAIRLEHGAAETQQLVPVSDLKIKDYVLVRPGDRVPVDGVVVSGTSSIDESMMTGESVPVKRTVGEEVVGGSINQDGALVVRVKRIGADTALAQIVKLVENAQNSKPPVQKLADKIASIFVPVVLLIALITGVGWYLHGGENKWGNIAQAVCSVLIIACPCALGLAVPAALMVGTGRGAKMGILYRDIDALQSAEKIRTVVLDKTGTITRGKPSVSRIIPLNGESEDKIIQLAGSLEQFASHPIARSIVANAHERKLALTDPDDLQNEPGYGVRATIYGDLVKVGSAEYVGLQQDEFNSLSTIVYVARNNQVIGSIELTDQLKPDSAQAVKTIHQNGLKTVLLTGDREQSARQIASQVGIDEVRAQVKPGEKAQIVTSLQQSGKIAMVGDGINDAPALAQSDLGIAIGSGSDIAKETGDIVLVSGSLMGVPDAIQLSRATMRVIRQNLFLAFFYNVIAIPIAAFGLLSPIICAAAMALSDITVIGNALRLKHLPLRSDNNQ